LFHICMMAYFKRIILLILDACGVGALPDAGQYGDSGSNTIANTAQKVGGLHLPNLGAMGLGCIDKIREVEPVVMPLACYGKMAELSQGKDSTVGHWEIAGLVSETPFPVFPDGFPPDMIEKFETLSGFKTIGNKPASGTKIIEELGDRHRETGHLIVYTSADSVFQIAAHKETIPLQKLYEVCRIARDMLTGKWGVSRVIARPFEGESGSYKRTPDRKDFSIKPPRPTVLDKLKQSGHNVVGIGKIEDLFAGQGLTASYHTKSNREGVNKTVEVMNEIDSGLIFINLVDFDMLWGHRNDYESFAQGLQAFDRWLPEIVGFMTPDDLLIITADHGCDPTTESTDHSREYVPLLVYSKILKHPRSLGIRETFADVAQTICQNFKLEPFQVGKGFLDELH
jgi:phosphopentomutase